MRQKLLAKVRASRSEIPPFCYAIDLDLYNSLFFQLNRKYIAEIRTDIAEREHLTMIEQLAARILVAYSCFQQIDAARGLGDKTYEELIKGRPNTKEKQ